jgi:hypothetical protein
MKVVPDKEGSVTRRSNSALRHHHAGEAVKGSGAHDEILTYMYVKPQVHWISNEEDPPTDPFRIDRGLCPSGTLVRTLWQRDLAEPSLELSIYDTFRPGPWLLPG